MYYLPFFNIVKFGQEYHEEAEYEINSNKNHGTYIKQSKMVGYRSIVYR